MWLKAAALSLLGFFSSYVKEPVCPGLVLDPEPRHEPWNIKYAEVLAREIQDADQGEGFELLFYGDSITEQWRGTDQGGVCTRCIGDQEIFKKYFGKYRSDVLAVGGDQVGHLMWRLLHGDIPRRHHPQVALVMIGINDLGAAADCSQENPSYITQAAAGVIERLTETIQLLRERLPDTKLLMLALLPRGDGSTPETTFQWPSRYTEAIQIINRWLQLQAFLADSLAFLDCGDRLLQNGKIVPEIQVDGLHPSPAGMEIMAECISPVVEKLMGLVHLERALANSTLVQ